MNPPNAVFQAWDGSWYELRHRVEGILAGEQPPRLVIYAPVSAPGSDPLAEIRQAGTQFTLSVSDPTLTEGNSNGGVITFKISVSPTPQQGDVVDFDFSTGDDTCLVITRDVKEAKSVATELAGAIQG